MNNLFLTQLLVSFFLCGLIWLVQLVHYPSFRYVARTDFTEFENFHTRKITLIVLPAMFIELVTAFLLVLYFPSEALFKFNICIIVLIWISTFVFSVPCHNKLLKYKDNESIDKLVQTNWFRTFLWSIKTFVLTFYIFPK